MNMQPAAEATQQRGSGRKERWCRMENERHRRGPPIHGQFDAEVAPLFSAVIARTNSSAVSSLLCAERSLPVADQLGPNVQAKTRGFGGK